MRKWSIWVLVSLMVMGLAAMPTQAQQQVNIEFWSGLTGPDGEIMRRIVDDFVADNPGYDVNVQLIPWGTYFDRLLAALAAGTGPDLFLLWHNIVPQYQQMRVIQPVDDMFGPEFPRDDMLSGPLESVTIDGSTWGIPMDNYGVGLYVNRELIRAAGLDADTPPRTFEEFLHYAQMLTLDENGNNPTDPAFDRENVVQWGFHTGWWRAFSQAVIFQHGGDFISRDGRQVRINEPESVAAVQLVVDLIDKYHVAPNPEGFDAGQAFGAGRLAMTPDGCWWFNWFADKDIDAALWPIPQLGPVQPAATMWSHVLVMPATLQGDKLDATQALIRHISDNSFTWALEAGMPPARLSLQDHEDLQAHWTVGPFMEMLREIGVMEASHAGMEEILSYIGPAMGEALSGLKSPQEAMDDAARLMRRVVR